MVGERVLVSRDQSGENHEEATVYDYYELLIEQDRTPQVVVDFDDGQRLLLEAREPNVMAIEEDDVTEYEEEDDRYDDDVEGDDEDEDDEDGIDDEWDSDDDDD
jgi:hypothetical protein